ncbi:SAV_2336 N-terminal domain-related protein [Streptomyces sp. NBC_01198]|uniref:SAV_2336 N-terminal domain-related protein n=1 Tax=Streptomyces sp. NBC_01198 TaxID=2903769 RepID=UPI002E165C42|nr:SAV_2336 family protein [Streptomyces sp. NBC_01198]
MTHPRRTDIGPEEVADILWLAGIVPPRPRTAGRAGGTPTVPPPESQPAAGTLPPTPTPLYAATQPAAPSVLPPPSGASTAPRAIAARGVPVRVAHAPWLDDPLGVMRALRPLGARRIPGNPLELDEGRTAAAGIEQGILIPVMRPARRRWLDLTLVVDTHHSMALWRALAADLHKVLLQTGLFRTVRLWFLRPAAVADGTPFTVSATPGGAARDPRELVSGGHSLILLVTDTVHEVWEHPRLRAVIKRWSAHSAVALLDLLPERLWPQTAIRPAPQLLRVTSPASPTASWQVAPTSLARRRAGRSRTAPRTVLPVVDTLPSSLAALAALVGGDGGWHQMSCLPLDDHPAPPPGPGEAPPQTPLQALRRFEDSASPTARELAGYLAAVPLTLPVMNLVRHVMLPEADHGHLAEVALGGLLEAWQATAATDMARFEFRYLPGVRDMLLGGRLRGDITAVQQIVKTSLGAYLAAPRSASGDFVAIRVGEPGRGIASAAPFAEITDLATRTGEDPAPRSVEADEAVAPSAPETAPPRPGPDDPGAAGHPVPAVGPPGLDGGPEIDLIAAMAAAFEVDHITVDALLPHAGPLLNALSPQLTRISRGDLSPASLRVRLVLATWQSEPAPAAPTSAAQDTRTALRLMTEPLRGTPVDVTIEVRESAGLPLAVLYLLSGRTTVLTSYFYLPEEGGDSPLYAQPEEQRQETADWFESWWHVLESPGG